MTDSNAVAEFRRELRDWLAENCPPGVRDGAEPTVETTPWGSSTIPLDSDSRLWLERMAQRGYGSHLAGEIRRCWARPRSLPGAD